MKAIICSKYGSPEVLQLKEIEKPIPKDNEVLIKISNVAINSTDPLFRAGKPFATRFFTGLTKPKKSILGETFAGKIDAIGKNVTRFKIGDRIYGSSINFGAYAEYLCLPENGAMELIPPMNNFDEAAAIYDGALTALPFLRDKGHIQKCQNVLIYGASGSVGTAALQIAKYFGAKVTGVCSTANLELVRSLGADNVIDYTKADFTKTYEKYDIVFDTVGKSSYFRCKNILKEKGIYMTTVPSISLLFDMIWTSIFGSRKVLMMATGLRSPIEKVKDLALINELLEKRDLRAVIDRRYSMTQIAEAYKYVEKGHKKGNVVISIED